MTCSGSSWSNVFLTAYSGIFRVVQKPMHFGFVDDSLFRHLHEAALQSKEQNFFIVHPCKAQLESLQRSFTASDCDSNSLNLTVDFFLFD